MLQKFALPGGIILAGLATIAMLVLAKPKPEPRPPQAELAPMSVAVTEAKQQTVRLAVTAHGTVTPKREIDLIAQVSGQIVKVEPAFVDGGFFTDSEVLIQIDDRDYQVGLCCGQLRFTYKQVIGFIIPKVTPFTLSLSASAFLFC